MEKQAFYSKMNEVAKGLGMKMEEYPERYDNFCYLVGEDEIKICVSNGDYPKNAESKLRIYSSYPHSKTRALWSHEHNIEIGVSSTKTPEQIAHDIERRFLPAYLTNLEIIKAWNKRDDDYIEGKANTIKKVADHFGWELAGQDKNLCYTQFMDENEKDPFEGLHRVEAYDDKKVRFEIIVTPEKAIEIIDLLKT